MNGIETVRFNLLSVSSALGEQSRPLLEAEDLGISKPCGVLYGTLNRHGGIYIWETLYMQRS